MPATRSRNDNWQQSLKQLHAKGGSLEIALPHNLKDGVIHDVPPEQQTEHTTDGTSHIVWRVRIIDINDEHILIEQPVALGQIIPINDDADLIAAIAIGQNRWMFRTKCINKEIAQVGRNAVPALRIKMPATVERCQRRRFYRVKTMGLDLARVAVYPLLDLDSAAVAEAANRSELERLHDSQIVGKINPDETNNDIPPAPVMPVVGPPLIASLMNIGGGGVGIIINREDRDAIDTARHIWLQIDLRPHIPIPVGATARVRHTHIDSTQRLYAGLSFEFTHSPRHERFIVDQLCNYVVTVQRAQAAAT